MASALAGVIDSDDPEEIQALINSMPDPIGTFYRFTLPSSTLRRRQP
jgi:F420-non-reducing hydrogenase small subunit